MKCECRLIATIVGKVLHTAQHITDRIPRAMTQVGIAAALMAVACSTIAAAQPNSAAAGADGGHNDAEWPQYDENPFRFKITIPLMTGDRYYTKGGFVVHDVTGDGLMDYLVSFKDGQPEDENATAYLGAYDHYGDELSTQAIPDMRLNMNAENYGLPGHFGPGFYIADIDQDEGPELLHIDMSDRLVVRDARTGKVERKGVVSLPEGGGRWGGMVQVCNFRGKGMVDALLQAEYEGGDSRNAPDPHNPFHRVTAVKLDSFENGRFEVLWHNTDYIGGRHYGARAMDVDDDGRDEVCGAVIVDHDGQIAHDWRLPTEGFYHYDSIKILDALPDLPGLEVFVVTEKRGGKQWVGCVNPDQIVYRSDFKNREPQKGIVGEFDLSRPGLESWWASKANYSAISYRYPFIFDSRGELIQTYDFKSQYPAVGKQRDWSPGETTFIDWEGTEKQLAFMRGRLHDFSRGLANPVIFEPMTGRIVQWFDTTVRQCFPADVSGDYREEIIGIDADTQEFVIWWNPESNPRSRARYWQHQWYRVAMQISDVYSVK